MLVYIVGIEGVAVVSGVVTRLVCADMAEAVEAVPSAGEELSRAGPSSAALALDADERRQDELRKRERDPPIVYTDIDVSTLPCSTCHTLHSTQHALVIAVKMA